MGSEGPYRLVAYGARGLTSAARAYILDRLGHSEDEMTIAAWLAEQEAAARGRASDCRVGSDQEHWHRAQAAAYEAAHAYAVVRPDRLAPVHDPVADAVRAITDDDINWLAREAIRQNNRTLARIAAALLVGRP